MNVAVVGMGLIGGSFAKAFSQLENHAVFGENRSKNVVEQAIAEGVLTAELNEENIKSCKLIIVALYPQRLIEWLEAHAHLINSDAIVIDTCGVKKAVCSTCEKIAAEHGFTFIGAHPMAGVEHSGYNYSKADMFINASMILVPPASVSKQKVDELGEMMATVGFNRIVITNDVEHDRMIAYTSQLAHVVSSAYVHSPCALRHKGFSAGSYRDMTRVATLNEDMWTELFMDNSEALAEQLEELMEVLERYHTAIKNRDAKTLHQMLKEGRLRKEQTDGKVLK